MPKATKKQKEKVADFSKAKLKLGKGKQVANNATDTSYKARSIALPTQNPLLRSLRESESLLPLPLQTPLTSRGLTLPDVLILARHPNKSARKESLDALKEVLVDGMRKGVGLGRREGEVGVVVRGVLGLIVDDERTVRKALLGFLNWYLPVLPTDIINPHLPILLLQTSSALSHINPEVRIDACHIVSLLLDVAPSSVVSSWPYPEVSTGSTSGSTTTTTNSGSSSSGKKEENNILHGLRLAAGLGGQAGEGGAMGQTLLPGSKWVVLRTILGFVRAGLRKQGLMVTSTTMTGGTGSVAGVAAKDIGFPAEIFSRFEVGGSRMTRHPLGGGATAAARGKEEAGGKEVRLGDGDLWEDVEGWVFGIGQGGSGLDVGKDGLGLGGGMARKARYDEGDEYELGEILSQLYLNLQPLLLSSLLESAPPAFSLSSTTPAGAEIHLSLCNVIIDLVVALAGVVLEDFSKTKSVGEVKKAVGMIVNKVGAYFPFGDLNELRGQRNNAQMVETQQAISVAYSTLVVQLQPTPGLLPSRPKTFTVNQIASTVEAAFKNTSTAKTAKERLALTRVAGWLCDLLSSNGDALKPALSPHVYVTTLPVIWSLLTSFSFNPATDEDESIPEMMLNALLDHLARAGSDSATKRLGTEFVCRLIIVHEAKIPLYPFHIPAKSPCRESLAHWLNTLPRTLWELGNKDYGTTRLIFKFLLWLGNRTDSLFTPQSRATLRSTLASYFWLEHPTKGELPGPWTRLEDPETRKLALDTAFVWTRPGDELYKAVTKATTTVPTQETEYWARFAL